MFCEKILYFYNKKEIKISNDCLLIKNEVTISICKRNIFEKYIQKSYSKSKANLKKYCNKLATRL